MPAIKTRPRRTLEDFERLPEETRAELIDGEILMSPSPSFRHQVVSSRLHELLAAFVRARKLGEFVTAPIDVFLPSGDVVQPDLVFLAAKRLRKMRERVEGAPDLVIEILSPGNPERDRLVKRDLYARTGVPEYWIVDPEARTVEVLRLEGGRYGAPALYEVADTLASPTFPGLALAVREVMA